MRSNLRWCSDGFEISCWNGDLVRLAFIIDAHDREIIAWHAVANAGISGSMVRDRTPADRRMVLGLQRKPSPFWAQNALPKGVHASSITIALCPVKRGQLQGATQRVNKNRCRAWG